MPIDYKRYPKNWKTEIRPRILARAKNRCEQCNLPNYTKGFRTLTGLVSMGEYMRDNKNLTKDQLIAKYGKKYDQLKYIKIVLTIAHLDHDETNHNVKDNRLAALCQRCHLRYDAADRSKRIAEKKGQKNLFEKD